MRRPIALCACLLALLTGAWGGLAYPLLAPLPPTSTEDPAAKEFVRQRAVAGLGQVRSKEAVHALAQVLAAEHDKDITLTNLAHGGLVSLTGQNQPADPQAWDAVIQAGFEIAPEPTPFQQAVGVTSD